MSQFSGDFNKPVLGSTPGPQPAPTISPAYPPNSGRKPEPNAWAVGAALQWSIAQLGGPLVENESTVASGANPSIVVDGNGDRVGLLIVNMGSQDCFIATTSAVAITNGIRLTSNGGSVSFNVRDDFTLTTRRWYTQNSLGGTTLYIIEIMRFALTPPSK